VVAVGMLEQHRRLPVVELVVVKLLLELMEARRQTL
jgi:hypothetical protein